MKNVRINLIAMTLIIILIRLMIIMLIMIMKMISSLKDSSLDQNYLFQVDESCCDQYNHDPMSPIAEDFLMIILLDRWHLFCKTSSPLEYSRHCVGAGRNRTLGGSIRLTPR